MMKWTFLIVFITLSACQIDNDNKGEQINAAENKIIPELSPLSSFSVNIRNDIQLQVDSILKLAFNPVHKDSLELDTLMVLANKNLLQKSNDTLDNSIIMLSYQNNLYDSTYKDIQPGPYMLLSIFKDGFTVSSLYSSISQVPPTSILSESQMRKIILKKYPEKNFVLNEKNEIKLTFGYTNYESNNNSNQVRALNQTIEENRFYYGAIYDDEGYSHNIDYFDASNGAFMYSYYNSILEKE